MTRNIVGIDIGTAGIRAVELADADKPSPRLVHYREVALPTGAVVRGEVVEPNTVADALKSLWSAGGFTSKRVVLGIGNHRALVRDLTVPKMTITRIRETLPFLVQDLLPVPVADALLDFYPISEVDGETGPEVKGLLIAAVKETVRGNIAAVKLAGLTVVEVDLIPFALIRALCRGTTFAGTVALIDVGMATTSVVITHAGIPQFVRLIPAGGGDVTQALMSALGIDEPTAEAVKRETGLVPLTVATSPAAVSIAESTAELLSSLRNTVNYFANTRPEMPVTGLVLTGGGIELQGFSAALEVLTRLPLLTADPVRTVTLGRGIDAAKVTARAATFGVALGLVLGSAL
ncbi:type IV pilus assembly protein PilM [Cryobacterium sp. CG_9.6]|uniref:type IV pilus assembly protein PilM n=1 Tax=Cryobacterium sp. CG_9.6 TaxID=2760710 RepID=UPI0024770C05|nr:type IV pilus assembly protein PilM [Cryobacterium sp. CG_9.6]MDH6238049.1 type IV pilus assembly protein PilM [Cryobacterium sp. CG_9.6]